MLISQPAALTPDDPPRLAEVSDERLHDRFERKIRATARQRSGTQRSGTQRFGTQRFGTLQSGTLRFGNLRFGNLRFGNLRFGERKREVNSYFASRSACG